MKKVILGLLTLTMISCASIRKLPKEQYYSFIYYFNNEYTNDTLLINLKNPLMCPLRVSIKENEVNKHLSKLFGTVVLKEKQDTVFKIHYPDYDNSNRIYYALQQGDSNKRIIKNSIAFPFPKGRSYKIIQGYNGKFTHNTVMSKYAIDFSLKIGDTITCSDNGYVVGLIKDYKEYGTSRKWLNNDKSNYITVYHPHSGLFTQYVHLDYKGALVKLGDYVKKGQAIGICGMTGFTNIEHLHFNVKCPSNEGGLISTEIEFENGIKGESLRRKDIVTRAF